MVKKRIIRLVVSACSVAIGLAGWGQASAQPFMPGKIIERVVCQGDTSQSYALYIPLRGNGASGGRIGGSGSGGLEGDRGGDAAPLPVVYFFDPHGVGALPLRKYRSLAEAYGFILVGSNNSKN